MGYPLQQSPPQCSINGRTFAVGAFVWNNPAGSFYKIGVFENIPEQGVTSWNDVGGVALYANAGDCLADVQAKGGIVKFIQWVIAQVNAIFAKIFGVPPAPTPGTEPTTDDEAKAAITAGVNALTLTVVNGVPVLS